LLLIHGTGGSLRVWDPVVPLLAARRTVISVDLPGFGASPPLMPSGPPPTPAGFAVVLADLLRQLGHSTAHVAGNSVGGWTALEMAKLGAARSVVARSVVALSPAGLWARRAPLYDALSLGGTRRFCRLFDFLMPVLLSRPPVAQADDVAEYRPQVLPRQLQHRAPGGGCASHRLRYHAKCWGARLGRSGAVGLLCCSGGWTSAEIGPGPSDARTRPARCSAKPTSAKSP
jgi:pimeloyl-ACP methyl ester carboxylesterase